jgi:hypothetical protein
VKSFFLAFLLAPAVAFAAAAPKWSDFFDGDPTHLSDSDGLPFRTWIRGYSGCSGPVDQIFALVQQYDQAYSRDHNSSQAKSIYQQILAALNDSQTSAQCRDVALHAYWIAALNLGTEQTIPAKNDTVIIGIFLANQGVFKALTPDLRKQMAKEPKSLWTATLASGDYQLSGVYSCQDADVFISSNLLPYNMAGSLLHEMDHLYRDKIGYAQMQTWVNGQKDVRAFIVTDEIMAAIYGAYEQVAFQKSGISVAPTVDDFNLFSPKGSLMTLIGALGLPPPFDFAETYGYLAQQQNQPGIHTQLCKMNSLIRVGYFHQDNNCDLTGLFPPDAWISLGNFLTGNFTNLRKDPNSLGDMLQTLADFREALAAPGDVCDKMKDAEAAGQLGDYIGTGLNGTPSHPGNTGVKPCLRISL